MEVALLRGINVGGHRVRKDRLCELFEALGFTEVWTFLASGNVVFNAAPSDDVRGLEGRIERALAEGLGYEVPTHLRSPQRLGELLAAPWAVPPVGGSVYVILLRESVDDATRERLTAAESEVDDFAVSDTGREVFWRIRGKLSESPLFGVGMDKILNDPAATTRNVNTVRRLVAKLAQ